MREYDTRARTRKRTYWLGAGALLVGAVLGVAAWVMNSSSGSAQGESLSSSDSLYEWLQGVEAVVIVDNVTVTGETFTVGTSVERTEHTSLMVETLYAIDKYASDFPPAGSEFVFSDSRNWNLELLDGQVVLFLARVIPDWEKEAGRGALWVTRLAGTDSGSGLTLSGAPGESFNATVDEFASGVGSMPIQVGFQGGSSELRVMTAWVEELAQQLESDIRGDDIGDLGPLTQSFFGYVAAEDRWDSWYEASPTRRALGYGVTPPEVLATLNEYHILIDIPASEYAENLMVLVRTPQGVPHVAMLTAGPHPALVLTSVDDPFEIVISDDPETYQGTVVATIDANLRTNHSVLIELSESVVLEAVAAIGSSASQFDIATGISITEFNEKMAEFATRLDQ